MFEFDDTFDDLFEDAALPTDGEVFITDSDGRTVVARCRYLDDGVWSWDRCINWEELEPVAAKSLMGVEQSLLRTRVYPCPADIVARAIWSFEVPAYS